MNRLLLKIKELEKQRKKALVAFITGGYPDMSVSENAAMAIAESGADIIEIGVPFSDPVADGPTIQASSEKALKNGVNLVKINSLVKSIRKRSSAPIILMSYLNPLYRGGLKRNIRLCAESGADGFIIPDMIPEEGEEFRAEAEKNGLSVICMVAPNTPNERLKYIDSISQGFVYVVSISGVTGGRKTLPLDTNAFIRRTAAHIKKNKRFLGFGISNAEQIKKIKSTVDGVIVGSAIINVMRESRNKKDVIVNLKKYIRGLRSALDGKK